MDPAQKKTNEQRTRLNKHYFNMKYLDDDTIKNVNSEVIPSCKKTRFHYSSRSKIEGIRKLEDKQSIRSS